MLRCLLLAAFVLGAVLRSLSQFPSLHVFLNPPNCFAHSFGITSVDSVDERCLKEIIIPAQSANMGGAALQTLGLSSSSVSLRTLPGTQFYAELWNGAFSRFVFAMGGDTLYDTNLDFLPQYVDSINTKVAESAGGSLLKIAPTLVTSGFVSSEPMPGGVWLFDTYLDRIIQCTPSTEQGLMLNRTWQLPSNVSHHADTTLRASNLFSRDLRFNALCSTSLSDSSAHLLAIQENENATGVAETVQLLVSIDQNGLCQSKRIICRTGYVPAMVGGTQTGDTLYMQTYREGAVMPEIHFGLFVAGANDFQQVADVKGAEDFPDWIQKLLVGNYCDGFFSDRFFFFRCFPLFYDVTTMRYLDLSVIFGTSLEEVVGDVTKGRLEKFYCLDALSDGKIVTLLYYANGKLRYARIDLKSKLRLADNELKVPTNQMLAKLLVASDRALFISSDHLHSWILPLN